MLVLGDGQYIRQDRQWVAYDIYRAPNGKHGVVPGALGRSEFGLEIIQGHIKSMRWACPSAKRSLSKNSSKI